MAKMHGSSGRKGRMTIGDVAISAVLVLCALTILYPFYNAIMISIVPMHVYVRNPAILWPEEIVLDSYRFVLSYHAIWSGLKVTGIVTLAGTAYNMLLTVITAYVLTKTFPGKRLVQAMMIIPLYFGGGLVPYYLLIRDLGLIDSIWSMIVPTGLNYTYMLIVMRYIEGLPRELEEAAEIDGAGQVKKLFIIVLPMALPILATYTLYYAVDRWNEWWNGMLFIKSAEKQPLQLVLRNLVQDSTDASLDAQANGMTESYSDAIKMASIVITMVPILVLYPFLQRYFLSDLTQGAVKG
ncbi:MAG: carbohydrate ABC transporter permease [Eubacteriales bacterium]|nr:carbohydrate ABC transporter permease [Eubacteriales bacterium]